MAWAKRTDLEKEMRKANDRLRSLEAHKATSVPAYKEAVRLMRNATGDPTERVPRFRRSDYKSDAELRKALKRFLGTKTSTISGVNKMVKKQQASYSKTATEVNRQRWEAAGRPGPEPGPVHITREEAMNIGNAWEGIRKSSYKYNAATDRVTQELITRGISKGVDDDALTEMLIELRNEGTPIDEWEEVFDQMLDEWNDGEMVDEEDDTDIDDYFD